MDLDQSHLLDRLSELERSRTDQANEILCLKSSLADCLRRISALEKGPPTPKPSSFRQTPPQPIPSHARPTRGGGSYDRTPSSNLRSSRDTSSATGGGRQNVGKSLSKSASGPLRPTNVQSGVKEATYSPKDGLLRYFIAGRPVNVPVPTTAMQDFDLNEPQPAPPATLKLDWVYGYRGRDARNNLYYLPTGELLYFVAGVVVLYNIEEHSQRHYVEHTDDVKCLAVHPDRITIASGQVAGHDKKCGKAHIRIWSSVDLQTIRIVGLGDFERGLCCLAFSKADSGAHLCSIDDSNDHTISLWDWKKGRKISETKCSNEPVVAVEFNPLNETSIVTCGKSHLVFWTFDGTAWSKKSAIFEGGKITCERPKFVLCMTFAENGDLITGDSSGNILVWANGSNNLKQVGQSGHEGSSIFAVCLNSQGSLVSGGGKDGRLVVYDSSLTPTGTLCDLNSHHALHGWAGAGVRTICSGPDDMLLIGTTKNSICQLSSDAELSQLVCGHSDEFWGLAGHPQCNQFLTAGQDRLVILWDALAKRSIWIKELSDPIHCAAFYPSSSSPAHLANGDEELDDVEAPHDSLSSDLLVALGTTSGRWMVMNAVTREVIAAHSDGIGEQIQCIAYSPDGAYLALGSRDNSIYLYQVTDRGLKYTRIGHCSGHSSFVLQLDWSLDSQYLRTVSGAYELLYWTARDCKQVTSPSSLRDLDWASQSCVLGYGVAGIWPDGADGTDVNACAVSRDAELLATADDFGKIKLFQYPVEKPKAGHHTYSGHSSHVANVSFLADDSRLVSAGGLDTAVLQWEICV